MISKKRVNYSGGYFERLCIMGTHYLYKQPVLKSIILL